MLKSRIRTFILKWIAYCLIWRNKWNVHNYVGAKKTVDIVVITSTVHASSPRQGRKATRRTEALIKIRVFLYALVYIRPGLRGSDNIAGMITLHVIRIVSVHTTSETTQYTSVSKSPMYFVTVQITKGFAGTSRLVKFSSKLFSTFSFVFEVLLLITGSWILITYCVLQKKN
jgi:hypothetical protein